MPFTVTPGHLQADGRRWVEEVFFDAFGNFYENRYLGPGNADYNAIAAAKEADLIRQFSEVEARSDVDSNFLPTGRFQTVGEELLKIRERYLKSTGIETCRIARWIVDRLNDGSVTVVQMRTAFNVTPAQWNSINGRMDNFSASLTSVENAVGE